MPTTQANIGDWIAEYSDEPEKVREFCVRHGILDRVHTTIELARRNFPPIENLTLRLWKDSLEELKRFGIYLMVRATIEEALDGYRRFMPAWCGAAPCPERDKIGFTLHHRLDPCDPTTFGFSPTD